MSGEGPITAMIVDDDDAIRELEKTVLLHMGCEIVAEASDGQQAIDLFDDNKADLVLLDIRMPGMGGIEVLRELKRVNPTSYIVMMTSVDDQEAIEDCMIAGARDYIRKDTPPDRIISRLQKHVNRLRVH